MEAAVGLKCPIPHCSAAGKVKRWAVALDHHIKSAQCYYETILEIMNFKKDCLRVPPAAMRHHDQKVSCRGKGYIWLTSPHHCS